MFDSHKHGNQAEGITNKLEELNNLFDYFGKTHNLRGRTSHNSHTITKWSLKVYNFYV